MEAHTQTLPLTLYISLHSLINHGKQTDRRTKTSEIQGLWIRIRVIFGSWIRIRIRVESWIRIRIREKLDPDARNGILEAQNGPEVYTVDQWSQIPITLMRSRI
jgi:hypothetical protein